MPHLEEPPARLAAGGERLGEDVVEALARGQPPAELVGLGAQLVVREGLHRRFELVDPRHDRAHPADLTLVGVAEEPHQAVGDALGDRAQGIRRLIPNFGKQFHCQVSPRRRVRILCNKSNLTPILHQPEVIRQAGRSSPDGVPAREVASRSTGRPGRSDFAAIVRRRPRVEVAAPAPWPYNGGDRGVTGLGAACEAVGGGSVRGGNGDRRAAPGGPGQRHFDGRPHARLRLPRSASRTTRGTRGCVPAS